MTSLPNKSPKGLRFSETQHSKELAKVILNQLSILISTLTEENWETNHKQIRYITRTNKSTQIKSHYLEKLLILCLSSNFESGGSNFGHIEKLLKEELDFIAEDLNNFELLCDRLEKLQENKTFSITDFVKKFDCDIVLSFVLVIRFKSLDELSVRKYIQENCSVLLSALSNRKFPLTFNWTILLDLILNTPFFPLINKLLTLTSVKSSSIECEPVQRFYQSILQMSFKELLIEIGPENLLPDKLLYSFLQLKPNEVEDSLALILSEILIPGSQGLSNTNERITALTASNNVPEANAKGAQVQNCINALDSDSKLDIDWSKVFTKMQEYLEEQSRNDSQPTMASIVQILSSLDFKKGPIDLFLLMDWWFKKTLLYFLLNLDPALGDFDILSLENIASCYDDDLSALREVKDSEFGANGERKNLLKFISIAKLELNVLTEIYQQNQNQQSNMSEQDKKLNVYITQVFEHDYRVYPEYLLAAALLIRDKSTFVVDLVDTLFTLLMDSDSMALGKVIQKLKAFDEQLAVNKFIDYYSKRNTTEAMSRVVKAALGSSLLNSLLEKLWSLNFKIGLAFTIEAGNYGFDLEPIIESKFVDKLQKMTLCQCLLEILEMRAAQDEESCQRVSANKFRHRIMRVPVLYYLLEKLKASNGIVNPERLKNLQLQLLVTYPRLINFGCGHDAAILANGEDYNLFSPEVEQEMKSYYSKMYNKELEIKDIVDMLSRMKNSDVPHDQDIFACMIHSLIDEYRFFSEYPLTALASTSLLFGALLQKDLIQGTALTVALNFIWESCNQPPDSHLFKFAVQSLYNFKSRLHEYPIYCKHLLKCESLSTHAKMFQIVKDAANGIPCVEGPVSAHTPSSDGMSRGEGVKYYSISISDVDPQYVKQELPPESVSDKLLFFVNNLTSDNLATKLPEVRSILSEEYFSWFANYLVVERAKSEPNNHKLYAHFVEEFGNSIFFDCIVFFTIREVDHIIRNFKDSSVERNHLKNLGSWLGTITLALDRPLKRSQIALKYLLVESYDHQSLALILPFVCKILDQAKSSKVFAPPNPWTLGILEVLIELYECADLKLNLKFEIEVLLNSFNIRVDDIEASNIIRNHNPQPASLAMQFGKVIDGDNLLGDMVRLNLEAESYDLKQRNFQLQRQLQQQLLMQQQSQPIPGGVQQVRVNGEESVSNPTALGSGAGMLDTSFSKLVGNTVFTQNPNLRRAFQASLSRAVRECAVPIMSRVSEAVLTTTEVLIRKDFACEGDVTKFVNSYKILAHQLSRSMVVCSGRKLLSETIETTMIQLLGNQINPNDLPLSELALAVQQNVDLCVDIVDKIAAGNISELVDERMQKYVVARERNNSRKPYVEEGASEYARNLPQPLGLRAEGLTQNQLKIYENFGSNGVVVGSEVKDVTSPVNSLSNSINAPNDISSSVSNLGTNPSTINSQQQVQTEDVSPSIDQLLAFVTHSCEKAIQYMAQTEETRLEDLSADSPIMVSLSQALSVTQANALKYPELLLRAAQYTVNCLFTQAHDNPMSSEIYVVFLDKLCEFSPSTAKDVTWWLVNLSDQRKFNIPVIYSLLKVRLIDPIKFDISLSKLLNSSTSPIAINFATNLLFAVFSSEDIRPIALRAEFGLTLDALSKLDNKENSLELQDALHARERLFDLLEKHGLPSVRKDESTELYSEMCYVFSEWIKLIAHGESTETLESAFIARMKDMEILTNPHFFETFFRAAIDISITVFSTEHEIRARTQHEAFLSADALARLIVKIILSFDKNYPSDAISYLKNIVSILLAILTDDHEASKGNWNERAYFRIFSSILCAWNDASIYDAMATSHLDAQFYVFMGNVFNSLQPLVYPGFTFAWISLIGHRMFLPRLLEIPERGGYCTVVKLLSALLKFENVYNRDEHSLQDVINVIFKAINRLFVGILHDYPEFLVESHYPLISAVPQGFVQLKNIMLAAVPSGISVVDPFTQGLKVERIPEINNPPTCAFNPGEDLAKAGLKKPIDSFLRIPAPALIKSIYSLLKQNRSGTDYEAYNIKLINALVLYVGKSAVADVSPNNIRGFNSKSPQVSILVDLMSQGPVEFKYHLISSITNQLRYPNSHTHWFIGIILHFFSSNTIWGTQSAKLILQEIITRVLLERHMACKPHAWGLTIVFTELIKNGDFGFFDLPFVKDAPPELKVVFDSLRRNFRGSNTSQQESNLS